MRVFLVLVIVGCMASCVGSGASQGGSLFPAFPTMLGVLALIALIAAIARGR